MTPLSAHSTHSLSPLGSVTVGVQRPRLFLSHTLSRCAASPPLHLCRLGGSRSQSSHERGDLLLVPSSGFPRPLISLEEKKKKKKKENPSGLPAHMCRSCSVVTLSVSHSSRLCFTLKLRVAPRWGHLQAPGSTHLALIPYRSDAAPKNKRASLHKLPPARLPQWEKEQRD